MDEEQVKKNIYELTGRVAALEYLLKHVLEEAIAAQDGVNRLEGLPEIDLEEYIEDIEGEAMRDITTATFPAADPALSELLASYASKHVSLFLRAIKRDL